MCKHCECCGKPITGESLYHPGTHLYVCSFACHKHLTEEMITTYGKKRGESDDKTSRDLPEV